MSKLLIYKKSALSAPEGFALNISALLLKSDTGSSPKPPLSRVRLEVERIGLIIEAESGEPPLTVTDAKLYPDQNLLN